MPNQDDVLINFVGDTSGLVPIENALDSIVAQSGQVGAAWKKTSDAMNAGTKSQVDISNKLIKGIQDLANAAKSMDKAVIGGAYAKYLKDIQAQLGLTNKEVIAFVQNARQVAQQNIFAAETDEEVDQITFSIEAMNEQLRILGAEQDGVGGKTQSLRSRIREAKEELVAMAEAGLQGTPAFNALQQKAGELDDQMKDLNATVSNLGSDTANIEGLVSIASGVAGGFAVAQGAAALFGDGEEEVQKALLKVNAAMSILQGLQQVQNVLQKESQATLLLKRIFLQQTSVATVQNTVATEANVIAEGQQVVASGAVAAAEGVQATATGVATEAQVALNTAMSLNPIAVVIAAVVALTAAIAYFATNNNNAAKEQANLNDALRQASDYLDINLTAQKQTTDSQVALAKKRGASVTELASIEGKAGIERLNTIDAARVAAAKAYNESKDNDKQTIEEKTKLYNKIFELQKQYQEESAALRVQGVEFETLQNEQSFKSFVAYQQAKVAATIAGSDNERSTQAATIRAIAAEREKSAEFIALTDGEKAQKRAEDQKQIDGLILANYQHTLKGRTAAQEAEIAKSKLALINNETDQVSSINKITLLEIEAIKRRRDEGLKGVNTNNTGERKKINDEANLAIAEAEKKAQLDILNIQKEGINNRLPLATKGTQEEYLIKIEAIQNEQQIELATAGLTAEQINIIKAKGNKQREDALRSFNEAQIQNEISLENAALDRFGISEAEKLTITINKLDEQRDLEISQAEGNAAKIVEINAKYDTQTREVKKAAIVTELEDRLNTFEVYAAISKSANERIISAEKSTFEQKKVAIQENLNDELYSLDLQERAEARKLEQGLILQKDYDVAVQAISNKRTAAIIKSEEEITAAAIKEINKRTSAIQNVFNLFQKGLSLTIDTSGLSVALTELQNFGVLAQDIIAKIKEGTISGAEGMKELAIAATAGMQNVINQVFADNAASRQQLLSETIEALEEQKAKELDNKNLTEQQKSDIEKKYKEREKQEKIKAFLADKEAKKEQAVINGLLGITLAFATNPFPYSAFVAGIVAASTLLQVSKINSAKTPKFKHGKIAIEGPGTTTSDSIPAMISRGESVINADATAKWKDALQAINSNKFEYYLTNKMADFVFPHVPENLQPVINNQQIDYDKLSTAIAEKMKGIIPGDKSLHVNIDKEGIRTIAIEGNSRTEYKNKRYSMT